VAAWVIPTDEERVIAEETLRCLAVSMEATR
jgi:acetate kinase